MNCQLILSYYVGGVGQRGRRWLLLRSITQVYTVGVWSWKKHSDRYPWKSQLHVKTRIRWERIDNAGGRYFRTFMS
ncbi:hypothetical protein BDZ94DRAFT_1246015 [Collybia nuda]|uniref:Uncharacterized protein n=1 Tax=Collybia nuda TaxID=64659 RepID=A0A9P5YGW8_9AGAR|nr:hypothetical protein BDZ94DRAFT_1246015 [Collybia nuda]